MDNLLASVMIPVYNCAAYLPACFASLDAQTRQDFEVIIIDDGSADESGRICDAYTADHPNATVLHQENRGVSAARNAGIALAKGKYLVFLDADDVLHPHFMSYLGKAAQSSPVMVGWRMLGFRDAPGFTMGNKVAIAGTVSDAVSKVVRDPDFAGYIGCKAFLRKEDNVHFDEKIRIMEDLLFTIEYLQSCPQDAGFIFYDAPLYAYRQHIHSAVHGAYSEGKLTSLLAQDQIISLLENGHHEDAEFLRDQLLQALCVANKKLIFNTKEIGNTALWKSQILSLWKKHSPLDKHYASWDAKHKAYRLLLCFIASITKEESL